MKRIWKYWNGWRLPLRKFLRLAIAAAISATCSAQPTFWPTLSNSKPPAAGGAVITFVQGSGTTFNDNSSSASSTLNGVTSGSVLIFAVACQQSGVTTAITGPGGYSIGENPVGTTVTSGFSSISGIWYKTGATSGTNTATATMAAGSYSMSNLSEWTIASAGLDKHTNNGDNTGTTSGDTGTTATTGFADELVFVVNGVGNGGTTTNLSTPPSSGYTSLAVNTDETTHAAGSVGYKIVSATGTFIGSWTWTNSSRYKACICTFNSNA